MSGTLGQRIKTLRKSRGWTQPILAERIKLLILRDGIEDTKFGQQTISKQENSNSNHSTYITYYAEALGVTPRELLSDTPEDPSVREKAADYKIEPYLGVYQNLIHAAQNDRLDHFDKEILNVLEKKYKS